MGRYGGALGQPSAALWGLRSLLSTLSPRCDALGLVGVRLTGEHARRSAGLQIGEYSSEVE